MNKKPLWIFGSLVLTGTSLGVLAQQVQQSEPVQLPPLVAVPGTDGTITSPNVADVDRAFAAALSGTAEVPPNLSDATGTVVVSLNPDGNSLHYRLSVANIDNVIAAHLHIGLKGENGPIVVPLLGMGAPGSAAAPPTGAASGIIAEGDITADTLSGPLAGTSLAVLVELMRSGAVYANVHTTEFPGGEIRGQVKSLGANPEAACRLLEGVPIASAPDGTSGGGQSGGTTGGTSPGQPMVSP